MLTDPSDSLDTRMQPTVVGYNIPTHGDPMGSAAERVGSLMAPRRAKIK
jgi:hypothetical protein